MCSQDAAANHTWPKLPASVLPVNSSTSNSVSEWVTEWGVGGLNIVGKGQIGTETMAGRTAGQSLEEKALLSVAANILYSFLASVCLPESTQTCVNSIVDASPGRPIWVVEGYTPPQGNRDVSLPRVDLQDCPSVGYIACSVIAASVGWLIGLGC